MAQVPMYSFSGISRKRLVAYDIQSMSGTAGREDALKADVAWNVQHMEKLIVAIPQQ